jgi:hypothetical protein
MNARSHARRAAVVAALVVVAAPARAQDRPAGPTATVSVSTTPAVRLEVAPDPIPIGATGTLGVRVTGLNDIRARRVLRLVNASPDIVRLEGGWDVVLMIEPGDVGPDGTWSTELALTALAPGGWRIRVAGPATVPGAVVPPPVVDPAPVAPPAADPPPVVDPAPVVPPAVVPPPVVDPTPVSPPAADPPPVVHPTPVAPPADPAPGAEPWRPRAALEVARGRWAEGGIDDYRVDVERVCFCPPEWRGPVRVVVRDGVVIEQTYVEGGRPVTGDRVDLFPGIEGIFEFVDEALDESPQRLDAEYDRLTGRPIRVWVDYDERLADEERGFTTSNLVIGG